MRIFIYWTNTGYYFLQLNACRQVFTHNSCISMGLPTGLSAPYKANHNLHYLRNIHESYTHGNSITFSPKAFSSSRRALSKICPSQPGTCQTVQTSKEIKRRRKKSTKWNRTKGKIHWEKKYCKDRKLK